MDDDFSSNMLHHITSIMNASIKLSNLNFDSIESDKWSKFIDSRVGSPGLVWGRSSIKNLPKLGTYMHVPRLHALQNLHVKDFNKQMLMLAI